MVPLAAGGEDLGEALSAVGWQGVVVPASETAESEGLDVHTSTVGTGTVLAAAVASGERRIVVDLTRATAVDAGAGILAGLIALPNKSAEQVLAMVKPQGIDLAAIGTIVGAAHDLAARQLRQSDAIVALIEHRHQEEVARLGAAANKENTQFDAVVKEHAAAIAQATALDAQIAHLRQFFGFPPPGAPRPARRG